jgi:predicted permease
MLDILLVSTKATLKVVIILGAGAYLGRSGIFEKPIRKGVSTAFAKLMLPCMLFTQIIKMMSIEELPIMAWLAFGNIVYVSLGVAIGRCMVFLTKPSPHIGGILTLFPALGHANAIPFVLVTLLCSKQEGFAEGDSVKAQGYLGLYLVMHSFTLWGVGLSVIKKDKDDVPAVEVGLNSLNNPQETENWEPAGADERQSRQLGPQVLGVLDMDKDGDVEQGGVHETDHGSRQSEELAPDSHREVAPDAREREEAWAEAVSRMETGDGPLPKRKRMFCQPASLTNLGVPQWLNRPVVTALAAAILGLSPTFKAFFATPEGPANFAFGAMERIGEAAPTISLMVVGAVFAEGGVPSPSTVGYKPLGGVLLGRLVMLPLCCISLWILMRRHIAFFPSDRVFMLVLCLECCTPSAYALITMCVLQGRDAKELAAALFYQNAVAIFTMTAWVAVILAFVL